jgi:2-polyprenyl-3-methyl-5-hydroxy-6-metoxy-1,4-benzoquinol methylase
MPLLLAKRDPDAREFMDEPNCDACKLQNTYRQFRIVNLIARSGWIYRRWIKPELKSHPAQVFSLLDIGFGGGDIALGIARSADRDGLKLQVTGIEIDRRAYDYVQTLERPANVSFRVIDVHELADRGERFDFVISNHMLHHLDPAAFERMLVDAARICRRFVLFIDLRRSDLAYGLFAAAAYPLFRNSFIPHDGLASLRRSYTYRELKNIAPPGWEVRRLFPFRLVLSHRAQI